MKQTLLRYRLPPGIQLRSHEFKELVAAALDGDHYVNSEFFHYRNGKPVPDSQPDIRFVGGKGWVGILSQSGAQDSLMAVAAPVVMALNQTLGKPVSMEIHEPEWTLETTQYPVQYHFREIAFRKQYKWHGTDADLITQLVIRSVRRDRDLYGLDLPGIAPGTLPAHEYEQADTDAVRERLAIVVHDVRSAGVRMRTATGNGTFAFKVLNGTLSMNLNIKGIWQIGSLVSRGYGRIIRARGAQ